MDLAPALSIDLLLRLEELKPAPPVREPRYRVLHDKERYGKARQVVLDRGVPLPEIYPLLPNQFTLLTSAWQWLWRELNEQMTREQWRKLLHWQRAFTNMNGFERPGDPRYDAVNMLDYGKPLPKIESLVCGGAILHGRETTYKGERVLEVETLDGTKPPPPVETVLAREFYFEALSVRPDGGTQSFSLTPFPEYVPLIASIFPVYFPLEGLVKI